MRLLILLGMIVPLTAAESPVPRYEVKRAATAVGLDRTQFDKTRNDPGVAAAATGFDVVARADKVHSTPTVLVGKTGGTLSEVQLTSPTDLASVASAIQLISG